MLFLEDWQVNSEDVILEFNYKNPNKNPLSHFIDEIMGEDAPTPSHREGMQKIVNTQMQRTFDCYMSNVAAYVAKTKVLDPYTLERHHPDERVMRSVEMTVGVSERSADTYRRQIMAHLGDVAIKGFEYKIDTNPKLHKAIEQLTWKKIKSHATKILDNKKP